MKHQFRLTKDIKIFNQKNVKWSLSVKVEKCSTKCFHFIRSKFKVLTNIQNMDVDLFDIWQCFLLKPMQLDKLDFQPVMRTIAHLRMPYCDLKMKKKNSSNFGFYHVFILEWSRECFIPYPFIFSCVFETLKIISLHELRIRKISQ